MKGCTFFIANASYLGSFGNAANTVVFPLTVIALALAVMIGDGCCAFVSLSLGRNEPERARKSVGNSVVMVAVCALLLCYFVAYRLNWLPILYNTDQPFISLILPAIALSVSPTANIARFTRSEMIDVMNSDYILLVESSALFL